MKTYEVIITGSGIAGLSFALKVALHFPGLSIAVITKSEPGESNTRYAQGGIAAVTNQMNDSFDKHIQDTLVTGDSLCNREVVEMVVTSAPERIKELVSWGVNFDKDAKGNFSSGLEGGHSASRVLHAKDYTGSTIEIALLNAAKMHENIHFHAYIFAAGLIVDPSSGKCTGVKAFNLKTGEKIIFRGNIIMLASGGSGQVYPVTTNPKIATGDGIAMAYRAGAMINGMEFVQFHPTALYHPNENPSFLMTEALRGAGAILRNCLGEAFMIKYSKERDLAPRDIVSRAIYAEMEATGKPHVYLDCREMKVASPEDEYPTVWTKCRSLGIDPSVYLIPVAPAAHYICGGVVTDIHARTSIEGLYACGECACTGLHGANRLASNSLIEALVFSHQAYLDIRNRYENSFPAISHILDEMEITTSTELLPEISDELTELTGEVRQLMEKNAGIIRNNKGLMLGFKKTKAIVEKLTSILSRYETARVYEALNIATTAHLVFRDALARKENKGAHFNRDFSIVFKEEPFA